MHGIADQPTRVSSRRMLAWGISLGSSLTESLRSTFVRDAVLQEITF